MLADLSLLIERTGWFAINSACRNGCLNSRNALLASNEIQLRGLPSSTISVGRLRGERNCQFATALQIASLSRFVRRIQPPVDGWKYIGSGLIRLKEFCFRLGPSQPQGIGRRSKMELISLGRHVGCWWSLLLRPEGARDERVGR